MQKILISCGLYKITIILAQNRVNFKVAKLTLSLEKTKRSNEKTNLDEHLDLKYVE